MLLGNLPTMTVTGVERMKSSKLMSTIRRGNRSKTIKLVARERNIAWGSDSLADAPVSCPDPLVIMERRLKSARESRNAINFFIVGSNYIEIYALLTLQCRDAWPYGYNVYGSQEFIIFPVVSSHFIPRNPAKLSIMVPAKTHCPSPQLESLQFRPQSKNLPE